ncbi:MAG: zinc ribbon domain-containing protein [Betaproteobacteria bacterium]
MVTPKIFGWGFALFEWDEGQRGLVSVRDKMLRGRFSARKLYKPLPRAMLLGLGISVMNNTEFRCTWCGHKLLTEDERQRRVCDACTDSVLAAIDESQAISQSDAYDQRDGRRAFSVEQKD